MKMAVALILNVALLGLLVPWLRRQWEWASVRGWRWVFALGLGLRVGVGVWRGTPPTLDAGVMSHMGHMVTGWLWHSPAQALSVLTQSVTTFPAASGGMVYQSTSNTWMFIKLLALLNLVSANQDWLNALYLSLFGFIGCWILVRTLAGLFANTPAGAGAVAFLFWPSVWLWASGISKEAVLLGSGAWLVARVLTWLYAVPGEGRAPWLARCAWWLGTCLIALLHLAMRYFFAGPLLAVLAAMSLGRVFERLMPRRWAIVVALATCAGLGAWLGPELSVGLRPNKFVTQVVKVYSTDVVRSLGRPHFEYADLRPTAASIAAYAPQAILNTLTQPWLGQSGQPLYVAAGLENALLLLLLLLAGWAVVRGRGGHLPFALVLALVVFCLLVAFLIGITTPNLGSLHRYRSSMLPYLLLLLLQNDYAAAVLARLRCPPKTGEPAVPPPNA